MYSEKVLDHFTNPRNVGELPDADGVGEVGNARCGDIMKMYLKIDGDTITDVKFKTFGCGAAIATSSIATEMIKGHSIADALNLSNRAVVEALDGLPPAKVHCSVLAEQAVKAALAIAAISGERERPFKAEDVARITEGGHKGYLEYREGRKP